MSTLERAIAIAAEAHAGAVDKAGQPYLLHPLRVMMNVHGETARIAAVLHDVVEDTDWTLEGLRREGFDDAVLRAVDGLTWREGEDYFDFCRRAGRDPVARAVKLADIEDNLDWNRISDPTEADYERMERYRKAKEMLLNQATPLSPPADASAPPPS